MDRRKMVVSCVGCLLAIPIGGIGESLGAQAPTREVEIEGTVVGVNPMMVQMTTSTKIPWVFRLTQKTQVLVQGTAEKSFLRPGVFVEFTAMVDRKGNATTKVSELIICNPSPQKFPGVFPAEGGLGVPEPPAGKKEANAPAMYQVVGIITAVKNDQFSVKTRQGTVHFELDMSPKITVNMTNLAYVRQGDKIRVTGSAFREGLGEAQQVIVELNTPLTGPESQPKRKYEKKDTEKPVQPLSEEKPHPEKKSSKKTSKKEAPQEEPSDTEKPEKTEPEKTE